MDRLFDIAIVRPPAKSYTNCVSSNPNKNKIDISLALKQHENYTNILKAHGIQIIKLDPLEKYPDSCFVHDAALVAFSRKIVILHRFGAESRRGEETSIKEFFEKEMPQMQIKSIEPPGILEGGNLVVTDKGIIFVSETPRANKEGIEQLSRVLPDLEIRIVPISGDNPLLFHLQATCQYIGNDTIVLCPEYVNPKYFSGFNIIKIPQEELYANNMIYLGRNKILIPYGYPKTKKILENEGYDTIEIDISEFWKGDGGLTCLFLPFFKCI